MSVSGQPWLEGLSLPEVGAVRVHPEPAALPRLRHEGPGRNRFDDPFAAFAVRYAADTLAGCLIETMARFRPDPTTERLLADIQVLTMLLATVSTPIGASRNGWPPNTSDVYRSPPRHRCWSTSNNPSFLTCSTPTLRCAPPSRPRGSGPEQNRPGSTPASSGSASRSAAGSPKQPLAPSTSSSPGHQRPRSRRPHRHPARPRQPRTPRRSPRRRRPIRDHPPTHLGLVPLAPSSHSRPCPSLFP